MKFNHYYEKVFGINLYWFRGTRKQYTQLVEKEFRRTAPIRESSKGTFEVYKMKGKWIGVIWLRNRNFEVLAHECFHAVYWNLCDLGLTLTESSEETYAYLLQSLVKEMK